MCVTYHSVVYPHRFIVREYSFDMEEQMHEEIQQLAVHKKEQYVSLIIMCITCMLMYLLQIVLCSKCVYLIHRESLYVG